MTKAGPDPLRVPCPRCDVSVGEECVTPKGKPAKAHADRTKLSATLAERARLQADGDAEHRIEGVRWQRLYSSARLELEQRADWSSLAAEQLESVVLNMQAAEDARRQAKGKPLVPGSQGQKVANPAIAAALRYDAQALATARALRLTPDTRGASAPPLEDEPTADASDAEGDELAALDQLALRRREKAKTKRARRRAAK